MLKCVIPPYTYTFPKCGDLPERYLIDDYTKQAITAESDCLQKVLYRFLGRDVTIEDIKNCKRVITYNRRNFLDYSFLYKDIVLGCMTHVYEWGGYKAIFQVNVEIFK